MKALLLFVLTIAPSIACAEYISPERWMKNIGDGDRLGLISIPGTHDSGANREGDATIFTPPVSYITQYKAMTIRAQLDAGVRFLDIRCNQIQDACAIHHGEVYLFQNLTDVLSQVYAFLSANSSETVIMSIKDGEASDPGGNALKFSQVVSNYIQANPDKWYTDNRVPLLGWVRGKIVLLRRFGPDSTTNVQLGINAFDNWPGNTDASWKNDDNQRLTVQDYYNVSFFKSHDDKKRMILSTLDVAASKKDDGDAGFVINFTSAVSGVPNVAHTAGIINPVVTGFFSGNKKGHYGIIPMDFMTKSIARMIYMSNFKQANGSRSRAK